MQRTIQRHLSTTPLPRLRGVVFDMDGTLTVPNLDFTEMYSRCNVPLDEDLLEAISLMTTENAKKANDVIDEMEEEGRRRFDLFLDPNTTAILTRTNFFILILLFNHLLYRHWIISKSTRPSLDIR